jgi:O-antigen/teichoic acid export membrane protein
LTLLAYIFSETIVVTLFGHRYVAAITILQVIIFADLFHSMVVIFQSVFIGLGDPAAYLKCALLTTLVSCGSNIILTSRLGLGGTALAYLITAACGLIFALIIYSRIISGSIPAVPYIKVALIGIVSCIPAFLMHSPVLPVALVQCILSIGLYLFLLVVFRGLDAEDFDILSRVRYLRPAVNLAKTLQTQFDKLTEIFSQ